jgi:DNA adenine methylase
MPAISLTPARAQRSAEGPLPFIKWVGGKRSIAERVLALAPRKLTRYVEPFIGGGAVFFALRRAGFDGPAVIGDANPDLIVAYEVVRDAPDKLVKALRRHVNEEDYYYVVRATDPSALSPVDRAARFIYLNKTAFNGLWRENKSGRMNAPFGHYDNPTICDEARLAAASRALRRTVITQGSFVEMDAAIQAHDFVYCDPPYLPVSLTANFTSYSAGGFGMPEQIDLVMMARRWAARGARVVLSNADVALAHELYGDDFHRERVEVARAINSKGDRRGKVGELILRIGA